MQWHSPRAGMRCCDGEYWETIYGCDNVQVGTGDANNCSSAQRLVEEANIVCQQGGTRDSLLVNFNEAATKPCRQKF
jgi:hypothetical protein